MAASLSFSSVTQADVKGVLSFWLSFPSLRLSRHCAHAPGPAATSGQMVLRHVRGLPLAHRVFICPLTPLQAPAPLGPWARAADAMSVAASGTRNLVTVDVVITSPCCETRPFRQR